MTPLSLTTDQLRRLLVEIRRRQLPYEVRLAEDVRGPGGGLYLLAQTPVTARHLAWFESRNPAPGRMPTFVEVHLCGPGAAPVSDLPGDLDLASTDAGAAAEARDRA
ncbi:MAG: hypothetical protein ABIL09_00880, partial [Gemmatimonadota bacterium]